MENSLFWIIIIFTIFILLSFEKRYAYFFLKKILIFEHILLVIPFLVILFFFSIGFFNIRDFNNILNENDYSKKLDILFKVIAGSGALFLWWKTIKNNREFERANRKREIQTDKALKETERNNKESLITDRFIKAVEQLGSEKLEVRLGSIYTLDRIGKESEKDRQRVVNILCAYVRERSWKEYSTKWESLRKTSSESEKENLHILPIIDQQAIIDILFSSQEYSNCNIDLSFSKIHHIDCKDMSLGEINLCCSEIYEDVKLEKVSFNGHANFSDVKFKKSLWMENCIFYRYANFNHAVATNTFRITGSEFKENARFSFTKTRDAWFNKAIFWKHAWFEGLNFTGFFHIEGSRFYNFQEDDGLTEKILRRARLLHGIAGLPEDLENRLKEKNPSLFIK